MGGGHAVAHKRDAEGNTMVRAHADPILDTRVYQVEFPGGKDAESSTNVIAELLYTQCDAGGNGYLLWTIGGMIEQYPLQIKKQCAGQTINSKVYSRLTNLLPVEGWLQIVGEVI